ncbi:MAG TPA: hypothetical protein DHV08_02980 [Rhodocyclaceae bacterium]|nr:MAG: hypothetical protein AUK49_11675 [Betaproteobacteria bacterium CG2_30_68_42]PIV74920.1 MAG: hypothetical protein COW56_04070 [Rhodocyclales bacterium CG17_big_fil_post_rev_8_21_14_2_50_68_7]PIX76079.1 MAG: hypothetical protein COZ38_02215 [Rhodocyclales bacterium CG_4_10_14_3_um_filter_68_10]PJA57893.1 MAG: hypothetical protein CO164_05225 [Rhodocyclales bacterium CG_4_9_14_3_um_filter_68_10]HCX32605.1 hypothetical protein [Rhodocyclaceae bacterium]
MNDIVIRRSHGLTRGKARAAAERIAASLEQEFDLDWGWEDGRLVFRRSGVSGHLEIGPHHVEIVARLGFLLKMLKPRIEAEVHRYCDEQFGRQSGPLV